jgi:hypothetical protein
MATKIYGAIERAVLAVQFVQNRRSEWTMQDLADAIGMEKPSNAWPYLQAISQHIPVYEVSPYDRGRNVAARYSVLREGR